MSQVINRIQRVSPAVVNNYRALSSATVHEASGGKGALSSRIKPIFPAMRLCGPAVTVKVRPGDNLLLHKAIYVAQPGDVIVADADGFRPRDLGPALGANGRGDRPAGQVVSTFAAQRVVIHPPTAPAEGQHDQPGNQNAERRCQHEITSLILR